MATLALKAVRLGFLLAQAVSPALAGRAAFRLLCTTPAVRPKSRKARAAHAAGAERLAAAETITLEVSGRRVQVYQLNRGAGGEQKRYLVTHGWGASVEYMGNLISMLVATGAEVVALDFPGHGSSGGRFLHMGLAVQAIAAVDMRFGPFDAAIGHSFGGAALMVSAAGIVSDVAPVVASRAVLIGSPSEMRSIFQEFGRMVGLKSRAQAALEGRVLQITGRPLEDFDVAGRTGPRAVLVVHARDDKEVSPSHAKRYAAASAAVRLFWANGFGHRRIVSAAPVLSAISAFLAEEDDVPVHDGAMQPRTQPLSP
jgi:pimeloyl-ACP methyl ester carboxylesterase